jgi:hypothetical protein
MTIVLVIVSLPSPKNTPPMLVKIPSEVMESSPLPVLIVPLFMRPLGLMVLYAPLAVIVSLPSLVSIDPEL